MVAATMRAAVQRASLRTPVRPTFNPTSIPYSAVTSSIRTPRAMSSLSVLSSISMRSARQTLTRSTVTSAINARFFTHATRPAPAVPRTTTTTLLRRLFSRTARRKQQQQQQPSSTTSSSSSTTHSHTTPPPKPDTSLSGRLKTLSREYGWSALGVYLFLSALDFPFCYLLVKSVGVQRIGEIETYIVSHISSIIPQSIADKFASLKDSLSSLLHRNAGEAGDKVVEGAAMAGWGVEEADKVHRSEASVGTQLALAYAIHKSFIFVRVPLTAAVTPKIVKMLRGWGWDIGKRTSKAAKEVKRAEIAAKTGARR